MLTVATLILPVESLILILILTLTLINGVAKPETMPLTTGLTLSQMFSLLWNQIEVLLAYVVGVDHSWVSITTRLQGHRTEALRMVLAYVGVCIGCFILFIAIEIARERGRSKESLKRRGNHIREIQPLRGGGHERKKENGYRDEKDDEEQELMTKTRIDQFCKQLYKEWEGTLVGCWQICSDNAMPI